MGLAANCERILGARREIDWRYRCLRRRRIGSVFASPVQSGAVGGPSRTKVDPTDAVTGRSGHRVPGHDNVAGIIAINCPGIGRCGQISLRLRYVFDANHPPAATDMAAEAIPAIESKFSRNFIVFFLSPIAFLLPTLAGHSGRSRWHRTPPGRGSLICRSAPGHGADPQWSEKPPNVEAPRVRTLLSRLVVDQANHVFQRVSTNYGANGCGPELQFLQPRGS